MSYLTALTSINTLKCTAHFVSGVIWWLWSVPGWVIIPQALMVHLLEPWQLNVRHVDTRIVISPQDGRIPALCCRLWFLSCIHTKTPFSCSFLYTLYLAIDRNFKLKGKDQKLQDVELMPGHGVFVEESAYQKHIRNYTDQPEVCVTQPSPISFDSWRICRSIHVNQNIMQLSRQAHTIPLVMPCLVSA